MNLQRYLWLVALAMVATLAGCLGGSGSSGFDITENAAIEEAIDTQECQDFEGLVICPAAPRDTTIPTSSPTPTHTPPAPSLTPPAFDTPTFPNGTPGPETKTPTSVPTNSRPSCHRGSLAGASGRSPEMSSKFSPPSHDSNTWPESLGIHRRAYPDSVTMTCIGSLGSTATPVMYRVGSPFAAGSW